MREGGRTYSCCKKEMVEHDSGVARGEVFGQRRRVARASEESSRDG